MGWNVKKWKCKQENTCLLFLLAIGIGMVLGGNIVWLILR